ncbi:MAG: DsbA family protein, partial [Pseudomonadota bacterium]
MSNTTNSSTRSAVLTALTALVFGFLGAAIWSISGLADNRTRAFLMENPEVLPDMAAALQQKETSDRLADAGGAIFEEFPGAVLGNPNGTKVLVEFTDYNCPYCESSLDDVERLVANDPDLKVIVREWPIFEGSEVASRMALASARQGKYQEFHEKMFALGPATP